MDLLELAHLGAFGLKLAVQARKAQAGDFDAAAYVLRDSWREVVDLSMGVGTSDMVSAVGRQIGDNLAMLRGEEVEEGGYREPEPWRSWITWKMRQPSSSNIFVGQTGSGKTTGATQLLIRHAQHSGYPIEFLNFYGDDVPRGIGAMVLSDDVLIKRFDRLKSILKDIMPEFNEANEGDDEEIEGEKQPEIVRYEGWDADRVSEEIEERLAGLTFRGRCVAMDEMGLSDDSPNSPIRRAMKRALTQSRHVRWHVAYIGQTFSQFPQSLLGQSTLFIKMPTGREMDTDRQEPFVRHTWRRAYEAFARLREEPAWPYYPDPRAWAYVEAPAGSGFRGYSGLVPFENPHRRQELPHGEA